MLIYLLLPFLAFAGKSSTVHLPIGSNKCDLLFRQSANSAPFLATGDIITSPQFVEGRYKFDFQRKEKVNKDLVFIVSPSVTHTKTMQEYDHKNNVTRAHNINAYDSTRSDSLYLVLEVESFYDSSKTIANEWQRHGQKVIAWRGKRNSLGEWQDTGEVIEFVVGGYFNGASIMNYEMIGSDR